jgi:hypothetical protein
LGYKLFLKAIWVYGITLSPATMLCKYQIYELPALKTSTAFYLIVVTRTTEEIVYSGAKWEEVPSKQIKRDVEKFVNRNDISFYTVHNSVTLIVVFIMLF